MNMNRRDAYRKRKSEGIIMHFFQEKNNNREESSETSGTIDTNNSSGTSTCNLSLETSSTIDINGPSTSTHSLSQESDLPNVVPPKTNKLFTNDYDISF